MHITSLRINNFRGLAELALDGLPPTLIVTGLNGRGKSTILDAVRFALTGAVHDAGGRLVRLPDLIGPSGDSAEVALGVRTGQGDDAQDHQLRVKITSKGSEAALVDGQGNKLTEGNDATRQTLFEADGLQFDHAAVAGDPQRFSLSDEFDGWLTRYVLAGVDLKEQAYAAAGEVGLREWFPGSAIAGVEDLYEIGADAYVDRRSVNRQIKAEEGRLVEPEPPKDKNGQPLTLDRLPKLEETIEDLQGKQRELIYEQEAARKGEQAVKASPAKLKEQLEGLEAERVQYQAALTDADNQASEAKERIQKARERHRKKEMLTAAARERLENAQTKAAEFADGRCPTCGYKLSDKKLQELQGADEDTIAKLKQRLSKLEDELKTAEVELEKAERRLENANAAQQKARGELDNVASAKALLRGQLQAANNATPDARSADEITAEYNTTHERLEKATAARDALRAVEDYQAKAEALEGLRAQRDNLDWAVKQFRDGAFFGRLVQEHSAPFVKQVNTALEPYGLAVALEVDGASVRLVLGKSKVAAAQASKAERTLVAWGVAQAAASGSNALIMLDDVDGLDGSNKALFWEQLVKLGQAGRPIIAGAAWSLRKEPPLAALSAAVHPVGVVWVHEEGAALYTAETEQADVA
jgi:hypothetical protein